MPYNKGMNGNELLKKLKKLARLRDEQLKLLKARGKGSHGTLYYGDRKTTLKDPKKEIGAGLLKNMLEDLGLNKGDIEGL
ncbi:type II toxin-antitoxin system HicA family toxin [Endozoicomonas sp. 4G]|uniref:type II toxin-antitoxin system HicA family toxin n=1 Tax=Endozoicomonas sp. 4G TaxID=2872754 RepID=UPI0020791C63|nr:type II toxin-antitoxin system HicA family toxin [Endozoicomonas sp. 4G]